MTLLELRVSLGALLFSHLGQYIRNDKTHIESLWVGETTPDGYTMNSSHANLLECVISPAPQLEQIKEFGARNTRKFYRLTLKDWSSLKRPTEAPQGTTDAMEIILGNFDVVGTPVLVRASRDFIETQSVILKI